MSTRMDANVFVGQYPFRSMARSTVDECAARMASLGFERAVVSPMEAIFQEDSFAAEESLAEAINGDERFIHFKVVNPMQAWWMDDLERGIEDLGVKGVRLCGNYHGYRLDGPEADQVLAFTAERDLPVLVMVRMQDYRMHWMIRTPEAGVDQIEFLITARAANRLILAGLHFTEMLAIAEGANRRENVLLDTSRLKGPWKTFEKLSEKLNLSHVAFGSLWPINIPECPFEQIRAARLDEETKAGILGGNLSRLLGTV